MDVDAGELNERLTLRAPVASKSGTGSDVITYPDMTPDIWAKHVPLGMRDREFLAAGQKQFEQHARFIIRRRLDIIPTWRLAWLGEEYNVISITQQDRQWTDVLCQKGLP